MKWLIGLVIVLLIVILYMFHVNGYKLEGLYTDMGKYLRYPKDMLLGKKDKFIVSHELAANTDYSVGEFAEANLKKAQEVYDRVRADTKMAAQMGLLDENLAYFAAPQCSGNETLGATDPFAGKASYMDWVGSNLISADMLASHEEYVKSDVPLLGTGRLITSDAHDSYNPLPWVGLFRPQRVPVGNPDQIPDIDISMYSEHPTIRW